MRYSLIANINDDKSFFIPYLDSIEKISLFVDLAWQGLHYSSEATKYIELKDRINKLRNEPSIDKESKEYKENLKRAVMLEKFAESEKKNGFSYLYELSSVRLWSVLEAVVDDLVICLLSNYPTVLENEEIIKIKGPLVEFSRLSEEEQAYYLLDSIKRNLDSNLKKGIGKFESVLKAVNLNGPISDCVRKKLFELSQVRNVIVHRSGLVDKQILDNCPWLNIRIGNNIILTTKDFHLYLGACQWYIINLAVRLIRNYPANEKKKTLLIDKHLDVLEFLENRLAGEKV